MSVADVISGAKRWHVEQGDNLAPLRSIPDASVDAIVSDPPAWISFMNRAWDESSQFLGFEERCREMLRVAKPGAHALIWALPRTAHMTASALAGAGWEIRDVISDVIAADLTLLRFVETLTEEQRDALARALESQASPTLLQIFATGFPKSLNVSKAIDDAAGAEREVVGSGKSGKARGSMAGDFRGEYSVTAAATSLARVFSGYGTALKPAVEFWIVARKPLAGTVAANVAEHGTGAINVDGCRVGSSKKDPGNVVAASGGSGASWSKSARTEPGRWPTNLVLEHAPGCRAVGTRKVKAAGGSIADGSKGAGPRANVVYGKDDAPRGSWEAYADADGREEVTEYECEPGCPVRILDEQSVARGVHSAGSATVGKEHSRGRGVTYAVGGRCFRVGDTENGSAASRFFPGFLYEPKADRRTREAGLDGRGTGRITDGRKAVSDRPYLRAETERRNTHPTVKSDDLMRWLVRLVLPPRRDGQPAPLVLDPYNGSGSTGRAAMMEGARYIGLEREQEYADISRDRIRDAEVNGPVKREPVAREAKGQTDLMALFQEVKK